MKQQSGPPSLPAGGFGEVKKPIAIFGSGTIVQQFANLGLIDEYWLMVNPVILGNPARNASHSDAGGGKPLFADVKEKMKLKLLKTRTFGNGNILLYYQTDKK